VASTTLNNLSLDRPGYWTSVIGQDRVVKVLTSTLTKSSKRISLGWLFEGVHGVGKTTVGYIMARALMCHVDPLGCSPHSQHKCPSCEIFDETDGHTTHPDFMELDAASHSGVVEAREIVQIAESLPTIGRYRVVLIDEVHRLSRDSWDVYLKPLERVGSQTIFIFVTNDSFKIPRTIRSRVAKVEPSPSDGTVGTR